MRDSMRYNVKISNVKINGVDRTYEYWFKLTDAPVVPPAPLAEVPILQSPAHLTTGVETPVNFS